MTWFRVDDKWLQRPEVQGAGLHGRALWLAVGSGHCAAEDTDGMIDGRVLKMLAGAAEVNLAKASRALVEQGLWHDGGTIEGCIDCLEVAKRYGGLKPGDYFHHAFLATNLDRAGKTDQVHRDRERRRDALRKDKHKVGLVRRRDRDLCAYCGVLTRWGTADRKSKDLGEIDHLDPWGDNDLSNLRVACKGCNRAKSDRTPEQWLAEGGLPLLPFPTCGGSGGTTGGSTGEPRVARDSGQTTGRAQVGPGAGRRDHGPGTGPTVGEQTDDDPDVEDFT